MNPPISQYLLPFDVTQPDEPDRALAVDDREMVDPVLRHQDDGGVERRVFRHGDRLRGHPRTHASLARVHPGGERAKHVP